MKFFRVLRPSILGISVLAHAAPSAAPRSSPKELVKHFAGLLAHLRKPPTYETWAVKEKTTCVRFQLDGFSDYRSADLWCDKCVATDADGSYTYLFFPDLEKDACTLQQVDVRINKAAEATYKKLEKAVAKLLGPGKAEDDVKKIDERDSYSWKAVRQWSGAGDSAYLFFVGAVPTKLAEAPVGFLWRGSRLKELGDLNEQSESDRVEYYKSAATIAFAVRACKESGLPGCEDAGKAMSGKDRVGLDGAIDLALEKLKVIDKTGPSFPPLAYWIDQMVEERMGFGEEEDWTHWGKRVEQLSQRGLHFEEDKRYICGYKYYPDLTKQIASQRQDSVWGAYAFADMLQLNVCDGGDYRQATKLGEEFLQAHPESEASGSILLETAKAYETWWSLANAVPYVQGELEFTNDHPEQAETARLKAIELYSRYVAQYASRDEKARLQQILFRLKHKIGTAERSYACFST